MDIHICSVLELYLNRKSDGKMVSTRVMVALYKESILDLTMMIFYLYPSNVIG